MTDRRKKQITISGNGNGNSNTINTLPCSTITPRITPRTIPILDYTITIHSIETEFWYPLQQTKQSQNRQTRHERPAIPTLVSLPAQKRDNPAKNLLCLLIRIQLISSLIGIALERTKMMAKFQHQPPGSFPVSRPRGNFTTYVPTTWDSNTDTTPRYDFPPLGINVSVVITTTIFQMVNLPSTAMSITATKSTSISVPTTTTQKGFTSPAPMTHACALCTMANKSKANQAISATSFQVVTAKPIMPMATWWGLPGASARALGTTTGVTLNHQTVLFPSQNPHQVLESQREVPPVYQPANQPANQPVNQPGIQR
mmetsp:Transcript_6724/g.16410  ORF Transcript_6724/g.16410 Transcript_6724/m.16410 type:complete len:314 (+) Transcript_6724:285-1226(+)